MAGAAPHHATRPRNPRSNGKLAQPLARWRAPDAEANLPSPAVSDRSRADVAQLVEQLIRNQQVGGSSPPVGSKIPLEMRTYRRASAESRSAEFRVRTVSVFSRFASNSDSSLWIDLPRTRHPECRIAPEVSSRAPRSEMRVRAGAANGSTVLERNEFRRGTAYLSELAFAPASLEWEPLRHLHSPARSGSNFGIWSQA